MPDSVVPTTTLPYYKLCTACKYYDGQQHCISPDVQFTIGAFPFDLVTGKAVNLTPLDARSLRYGGACGAAAKWFVPK